jgi:hypothetical protein
MKKKYYIFLFFIFAFSVYSQSNLYKIGPIGFSAVLNSTDKATPIQLPEYTITYSNNGATSMNRSEKLCVIEIAQEKNKWNITFSPENLGEYGTFNVHIDEDIGNSKKVTITETHGSHYDTYITTVLLVEKQKLISSTGNNAHEFIKPDGENIDVIYSGIQLDTAQNDVSYRYEFYKGSPQAGNLLKSFVISSKSGTTSWSVAPNSYAWESGYYFIRMRVIGIQYPTYSSLPLGKYLTWDETNWNDIASFRVDVTPPRINTISLRWPGGGSTEKKEGILTNGIRYFPEGSNDLECVCDVNDGPTQGAYVESQINGLKTSCTPMTVGSCKGYRVYYEDNVGNWSTKDSEIYAIDNIDPPVINTLKAKWLKPEAGGGTVSVGLSWVAVIDNESGTDGYYVYKKNKTHGDSEYALADISICKSTSYIYNIDPQGPEIGDELEFRIFPQDRFENRNFSIDGNCVLVFIPRGLQIGLENFGFKNADHHTSDITADLVFNVSPLEFLNYYKKIVIDRNIGSDNPIDNRITIDPSTVIDLSGNILPAASNWSIKVNGTVNKLIYHDTLPAGRGHSNILYEIDQAPRDPSPLWNACDWTDRVFSATYSLPNHLGTITGMQITANQIILPDGYGGSKISYEIGSSLQTSLTFNANDIDGDNWTYRIYNVNMLNPDYKIGTESVISVPQDERELHNVTQVTNISVPIQLHEGTNHVVVGWTETGDNGDTCVGDNFESVLTIEVTYVTGQGYIVSVTGGWGNLTNSVITCRPGEPLDFSVLASADAVSQSFSCDWDMDGDNVYEKPSIKSFTYSYAQKPGRTGDTSTYTLNLRINPSNAAPQALAFTVSVIDTREGALFADETWIGPHEIVGTVIVPAGRTLNIEPGFGQTMQVLCNMDIITQNPVGIRVDQNGALKISQLGGTVTIDKMAGKTGNWDTVRIAGAARIGNTITGGSVEIRQAERALTIAPTGDLILSSAKLHDNLIGVHVVGATAVVTMSDTEIYANTEYGIKEDAHSSPSIGDNVSIQDNFRNYYDWEKGLLTSAELNSVLLGQGD